MIFPTESERQAREFEIQYERYVSVLSHYGRTPASREVILAEASTTGTPYKVLLHRKMATLEP